MIQGFSVEFSDLNKSRLILSSPLKVNCVRLLELLEPTQASSTHGLLVAFYNQVTLHPRHNVI